MKKQYHRQIKKNLRSTKPRQQKPQNQDMYINTIISPEGAVVAITPANGKYYTLEEMQEMVEGYIDIVTSASGKLCYVVHESGMYCKEFNGTATMHFLLRSGHYQEIPLFGNIAIIESKYMR